MTILNNLDVALLAIYLCLCLFIFYKIQFSFALQKA